MQGENNKKWWLGSITLAALVAPLQAMAAEDAIGWLDQVNAFLGAFLFFDVLPGEGSFPFIVAWLFTGGLYLTIKMGFINFRLFGHAIDVLRGKYSRKDDKGEVSHFQALTTALSATVGLGNIAGVALAISIGGPGATFWMILAGLIGMTSKFTEASLAQTYREVRPDGHMMGGAMEYLSRGFANLGWAGFGKGLAILFAILTIGASFGGGNAFQASQALSAAKVEIPFFDAKSIIFSTVEGGAIVIDHSLFFGLLLAFMVGIVIIGGLRRIAHVAEALVPVMVVIYLTAALWIIGTNAEKIPEVLGLIVGSAFNFEAGMGGFVGVIVQGFKRAAFSSEAGIGSAAIAHSAARTPYPVRQGIVALMEPFIDTVVICTMTALVIIITGVYDPNGPYADLIANSQGAALAGKAFGHGISWFPAVLALSVFLFAYSTMISWSYYGERCWTYLFGERYSIVYKLAYIGATVVGSVTSAAAILDFSDLMLLSMAFPNFIGLYMFSGQIKAQLDSYIAKLKSGELAREAGRA